jgi:hypothetical protein
MSVIISRLYDTPDDGRRAVARLEAADVLRDDISILANNADNWFEPETNVALTEGVGARAEGAVAAAGIGAGLGGVAGLLAGLGLLAIPGLGPVVAAGWLAATAVGAAAGAATGEIVGIFTGAGMSESDAEFLAEGLRRGGTVVSVRSPETKAATIEGIMAQSAVDPQQRRTAWQGQGWKAFDRNAKPLTADEIRQERARYR